MRRSPAKAAAGTAAKPWEPRNAKAAYPRSSPTWPANAPEKDLFEDIDTTWNRVAGAQRIGSLLAAARSAYDPKRPEAILPRLLEAYREFDALNRPELAYKRKQLVRAVELASGIWVDATAERWNLVPGKEATGAVRVLRRTPLAWKWKSAHIAGAGEATITAAAELPLNRIVEKSIELTLTEDLEYSQPPWLRVKTAGDFYERADGSPEAPETLTATFVFETPEGVEVTLAKPVRYRWVDRSFGERERRVQIVPAVAVNFAQENQVFAGADAAAVPVRLIANDAVPAAQVALSVPDGWTVSPPIHRSRVRRGRRGEDGGLRAYAPGGRFRRRGQSSGQGRAARRFAPGCKPSSTITFPRR